MTTFVNTIVTDLDDTLSFTLNRDWQNAKPNLPLIEKLNGLYYNGWEIIIVTARGQLSCAGDCVAADKKYRVIIEKWLADNNVKYHLLSFEKKIANFYIDDKAITPHDFLNVEIKEVKSGLSGAKLQIQGDTINKTANNTKDVVDWYTIINHLTPKYFNVPQIRHVIGDTLALEYIDNKSDENGISIFNATPHENHETIKRLVDIIYDIKTLSFFHTKYPAEDYFDYVKKIMLKYNYKHSNDIVNLFNTLLNNSIGDTMGFLNKCQSLCHGDFSIDNIILSSVNDQLYIIDPNFKFESWNSWLLDVSKCVASLRRFGHSGKIDNIIKSSYDKFANDIFTLEFYNTTKYTYYSFYRYIILILEISHWIRMLPYVGDTSNIDKNIEIILDTLVAV